MKRFSVILLAVVMALCVVTPLLAFAVDAMASSETQTPAAEKTSGSENVNITVVVPPEPTPVTDIPDPLPAPIPKPNPNPPVPDVPELYPSDVHEFYDATSRQIVKTYELATNENPSGISRNSFERDGWLYELADITKKENAHAATREHSETVTVETSSRDMDVILAQLTQSIEYKSEDGYIGVLALDISSITVEQSGTKKSSYTMTETREYPHLSSNDTSLVPKTITKGSVTYSLDSVTWQTQSGTAVDYDYIPTSYTAVAKYTASGSKTVVTGYTTTAEYKGTISKILTGKTVYTAYFIGQLIGAGAQKETPLSDESENEHPPVTTEPTAQPSDGVAVEITVPVTSPEPTAEPTDEPAQLPENTSNTLPVVIIIIAFIAVFAGNYLYYKNKLKTRKESTANEETD